MKTAIYGAGGFGKEVKTALDDCVRQGVDFDFLGYFDDRDLRGGLGRYYLGGVKEINSWPTPLQLVVAMGWSHVRKKAVAKINNSNIVFPNVVSPKAIMGNEAKVHMGKGCIVLAGANLTTDIQLDDFVVVNINATVGHDVHLKSFTSIMPSVNVSGNVQIGEGAFVGSGATILQELKVGDYSIVGAGAVVTRPVEDFSTVAGVPARLIRKH